MAKPIKFKNTALIAIAIFLVIVVGGSIFITKYNSKPEILILGKWNISNNANSMPNTIVEFTNDGKLITNTENKYSAATYKLDSSDRKNILLSIKSGSDDSRLTLKFISTYKFELSSPKQSKEVMTFQRVKN